MSLLRQGRAVLSDAREFPLAISSRSTACSRCHRSGTSASVVHACLWRHGARCATSPRRSMRVLAGMHGRMIGRIKIGSSRCTSTFLAVPNGKTTARCCGGSGSRGAAAALAERIQTLPPAYLLGRLGRGRLHRGRGERFRSSSRSFKRCRAHFTIWGPASDRFARLTIGANERTLHGATCSVPSPNLCLADHTTVGQGHHVLACVVVGVGTRERTFVLPHDGSIRSGPGLRTQLAITVFGVDPFVRLRHLAARVSHHMLTDKTPFFRSIQNLHGVGHRARLVLRLPLEGKRRRCRDGFGWKWLNRRKGCRLLSEDRRDEQQCYKRRRGGKFRHGNDYLVIHKGGRIEHADQWTFRTDKRFFQYRRRDESKFKHWRIAAGHYRKPSGIVQMDIAMHATSDSIDVQIAQATASSDFNWLIHRSHQPLLVERHRRT